MILSNFERMLKMADEVFAVKSDPSQLDVNQEVLERLNQIHHSCISEYSEGNGPVAWVLIFPTTIGLMNRFIQSEISEKDLFEQTVPETKYEAIYLCSALVLKEFQRKGIAKQLALAAIENIQTSHHVQALFVWAFSPEGDLAAETIARLAKLPLYKREK